MVSIGNGSSNSILIDESGTIANGNGNNESNDEGNQLWRVDSLIGYRHSNLREALHWLLALCTALISLVVAHFGENWYVNFRYERVPLRDAEMVRVRLACVDPVAKRAAQKRAAKAKRSSDAGEMAEAIHFEWEMVAVESMQPMSYIEKPYRCCGLCAPTPPNDIDSVPLADRMILIRNERYRFDVANGIFVALKPLDGVNGRYFHNEIRPALAKGLTTEAAEKLLAQHGFNAATIVVPGVFQLLRDEVLHPFFIFQIWSVVVWCLEEYYIFAGAIMLIAIISIVDSLTELRRNLTELARIARHQSPVSVWRDGRFKTISSNQLVPGDIVDVGVSGTVPCDMVLLSGGQVVVDESMLSGESIPVTKAPLPLPRETPAMAAGSEDSFVSFANRPSATLYGATKVLAAKPYGVDAILGMVTRTGFATTKGELLLSILYPAPPSFKLLSQSIKFILALLPLTLGGMVYGAWSLIHFGDSAREVVLLLADLVTILVPPSLPLALSVGTNFAIANLRRRKVFCISPARVNMAGKVRFMAFDKTGTLTEDGLHVGGVVAVDHATAAFRPALDGGGSEAGVAALSDEWRAAIAACHELTLLEGRVVGDPLDAAIFESARATLTERAARTARDLRGWEDEANVASVVEVKWRGSSGVDRQLTVTRRFEFQPQLQHMAALVDDNNNGGHALYVKGAPEVIALMCLPSTVPIDFAATLATYTSKGLRVIAYATARYAAGGVPPQGALDRGTWRASLCASLTFVGFVVLRNPVKPATAAALRALRDADVRCVMVTGDNLQTAVAVARDPTCGLVAPDTAIFASRLAATPHGPSLQWVNVDNEAMTLDANTLRIAGEQAATAADAAAALPAKFELAVSGDAYAYLAALPESPLPDSMFNRVLLATTVFARMRPHQKASLMTHLQSVGLFVGMCGDGANDIGALRAAHIGISLSQLEASVSAPFTCTTPTIACVPDVLREGRSSLVGAVSLFRFLVMYSLIQFIAQDTLYGVGTGGGNWQWVYQDLFVVLPLTIFVGHTAASEVLTPKRPQVTIFNVYHVTLVLAHVAIALMWAILVIIGVRSLTEYYSYDIGKGSEAEYTMEATSMAYWIPWQYVWMALLLTSGRPWKKWAFTNWKLAAWLVVVAVISALLLISPLPQHFPPSTAATATGSGTGSRLRLALVALGEHFGANWSDGVLAAHSRVAAALAWSDRASNTFGWFFERDVWLPHYWRMRLLSWLPLAFVSHALVELLLWPFFAWVARRCHPHAEMRTAAFGPASFRARQSGGSGGGSSGADEAVGSVRLFHRLRWEFEAGWPANTK